MAFRALHTHTAKPLKNTRNNNTIINETKLNLCEKHVLMGVKHFQLTSSFSSSTLGKTIAFPRSYTYILLTPRSSFNCCSIFIFYGQVVQNCAE